MFGDNDTSNFGYENSQSQFGGGGFMPEKAQSPAGGKGGRARGEQTMLPVTIKQILNAAKTEDETLKIDGREVNQVIVVGEVMSMDSQALCNSYQLDDGTGRIDIRWWVDQETSELHADKRSLVTDTTYVRVVGKIRNFQDQQQVVAFDVRPVKDFNEITCHMLQAVHVHLVHTTQAPASSAPAGESAPTFGYGQSAPTATSAPATGIGMAMDSGLSEIQKVVMGIIERYGEGEMGCEFGKVQTEVGAKYSVAEMRDAIEFLSSEGHLYSTIDEDHFKATSSEY